VRAATPVTLRTAISANIKTNDSFAGRRLDMRGAMAKSGGDPAASQSGRIKYIRMRRATRRRPQEDNAAESFPLPNVPPQGARACVFGYNVSHYPRGFTLPDKINQDDASAQSDDGVLTGGGMFRREPILRVRCCRLAATEIAMADDKTKRAPQDAKLISLTEDYELEY
jgi:hypothetical protein